LLSWKWRILQSDLDTVKKFEYQMTEDTIPFVYLDLAQNRQRKVRQWIPLAARPREYTGISSAVGVVPSMSVYPNACVQSPSDSV
jgi:hypothetical protein